MLTIQRPKAFALAVLILFLHLHTVKGQATYPYPQVNQSYIPPSPNAQAYQMYGDNPVALSEGIPVISLPIYKITCGSLTLPIALSYDYNGFTPLQDAGWVGLGWNLDVGGVISRIVEGQPDSSQTSGLNYGQYNITDSLFIDSNLNNFLANTYDLAPDIFDVESVGGSGKFFWYNGKPYLLDFNKQMGISWPSLNSNITVTSDDGTIYVFGAKEVTTANTYMFGIRTDSSVYNSAWHLTTIVSPDKKDTIDLNYSSYTWQQTLVSYQNSYTASDSTQPDLGYDTTSYLVAPSIQAQILSSITCRTARVSFLPSGSMRTDVSGSYPSLGEIVVIDSVTGDTVNKEQFTYGYFNQTATNPASYEHLKLKRMNMVNPQNSNDTMTYSFSYINEFGSNYPKKTTTGIDNWGYYNGKDSNTSLLPSDLSIYYATEPPSNFGGTNSRDCNFTYGSYAALDTLVYPTGGYTVFQYQQNQYYDSAASQTESAPGIRLSSTTNYDKYQPGFALQKNYTYLLDNGNTCSGILVNPPSYGGSQFLAIVDGTPDTINNYYFYWAPTNSGGIGGLSPKFYYSKVTESISSGGETHKSDYYYTSFNTLFQDVRLAKKIDYANTPHTNYFSKVAEVDNSYAITEDTSFLSAVSYITQEDIRKLMRPRILYTYNFNYDYWRTYWITPSSKTTIQYDTQGNSATTTTTYNFNSTTRNLTSTEQTTSDGQVLVQKLKYPEDYVSGLTGNMVSSRVLSPVIEKEVWMKRDASDSALIGGDIVQYDQTIFKPVATYGIETTAPIQGLTNETVSGGKYSSLLSTAQYVLKGQIQYDANDCPSTANKASDINVSYLWDYRHSRPVAEVKNASQADIAFCSFEADGTGNWSFTGTASSYPTSPVPPAGNYCYNLGQTSGNITKTGLTSATAYIVSYWTTNSSALSITGTVGGYPIKGKTIGSWTYYEHKITGQTSVTISGSGYIDELRLYPATAQMTTYTYSPLVGMTTQSDADNRITYYQYDGFGRLRYIKDQDGNIVKTIEYHLLGH